MEKEQLLTSLYLEVQEATSKRISQLTDKDVMSYIALKSQSIIIKRLSECPVAENDRKILKRINIEKGDATISEFLLLYCESYCPQYRAELISTMSILDVIDTSIKSGTTKFKFLLGYENISQSAKNGEYNYLVSRPEEETLHTVLKAEKMRAALITGPSRSGKTKLVFKFAADYPNYQIFMVSVNELISGTIYRGTMEQRVKEVLNEACNTDSIIFIDEFHSVFYHQNLPDIIKPFISENKNGLHLIGASTIHDLRGIDEKDPLLKRFTEIKLNPISHELIQKALRKHLDKKRQYHSSVSFNDGLLDTVYSIAVKLFPDQADQVTEIGDRLIDLSMANASGTTNKVSLTDVIIAASLISNKDTEYIFNLL
jgi:ATP-dependent Clp protease ATP-binding subunit ClpA